MPRPLPGRDPQLLFDAACGGDRGALARLLSLVERGGDLAALIAKVSYADGGRAFTVGITGAPGAGKSTLTNALVARLRQDELAVSVLAIDPSSPFSGGAILGDRVRMGDHALDAGVFIRSMATRGHLGGLALATPEAVRLLSSVGADVVLIETVGVGQVEVEVAGAADSTLVVVNPGWGDAVQANKAGLLEIADVFVINKADRPGGADTRRDLDQMLDLTELGGWRPPIVEAVAIRGEGSDELWSAVQDHRAHLQTSGELDRRRARRLHDELERILVERLRLTAEHALSSPERAQLKADVIARRLDPWSAADVILGDLG